MNRARRRLLGLAIAGGLSVGIAGPAFADGGTPPPEEGKKKCNSGGGNGSETTPATDCDPGNSGGHNNGKD